MTTPVVAVVTNDARKYWPQFFGKLLGVGSVSGPSAWNPLFKYFRVGEGGWFLDGAIRKPRTPDSNLRRTTSVLDYGSNPYYLQDLDIIIDPNRPSIDKRYTDPTHLGWFEKWLIPADFTYIADNILQIRCLLDVGDFNHTNPLDLLSPNPQIWELGIYSDHPRVAAAFPDSAVNPPNTADSRLLVAYGTFPVEIKDDTKQIEHLVHLIF